MGCLRGRVLERRGALVLVALESDGCGGCPHGGSCLSKLLETHEEVLALDSGTASPGQRVELDAAGSEQAKIACLIYLLPAICLVLGAALGGAFAEHLGLESLAVSPAFGITAAALSLLFGRLYAKRKGDVLKVVHIYEEEP